jgi:hypothetical protein
MADTAADLGPYESLLDAMFSLYASTGRAGIPAGRREEVVRLLTRAVAHPALLDCYIAELRARRVRTGPETELKLLNAPRTDIPWERIREHGFADLPDDVLADLATSPEALAALEETQFRGQGQIGRWFFEAIFRENAGAANGTDRDEKANRYIRQAEESLETAAESADGARATGADSGAAPSARVLPLKRWKSVRWAAVAASLLLAFFLGTRWPAPERTREVRLASVTVRGEVVRGIEDVAIDVANGSDRRMFLTFVGLVPGRKTPAYHYRQESRYVEVTPHGTLAVANLPPEFEGTTVLLVFSTPVPAGGVIREVIPAAASPDSAEQDAERIKKALADLGIDADVKVVSIPIAKR